MYHCEDQGITHPAMDYFEDLADFMNHHMDDPGWAKLIKGDF